MRATFLHSLICDNGILIANYAKRYGVTTIFVPVSGDDISSLVAGNPTTVKNLNAMTAVANTYIVTGDVSWLNAPTTVPADVTALVRVAQLYPQLKGVLYAIDPESAPSWATHKAATIRSYFTLLSTLLGAPGASAFSKVILPAHADFATLPNSGGTASPTMLQELVRLRGVSAIALIAPGNSESIQYANVSAALPQITKPFWLEASTSKYVPSSYYGVSQSTLRTNLSQLKQAVLAQNARLSGIEVNGWNDLYNSVQSVFPQPPVFTGTLATGPLVPPNGSSYLGAFVNADGTGQTPTGTAAFETQIGRTLAFNMHFYQWTQPFPDPTKPTTSLTGGCRSSHGIAATPMRILPRALTTPRLSRPRNP